MASGKILVAQGGGPTAVINQSLVGVALEARRFGNIERIYGAMHGVRGIVDENFVDLTQETSHNLELVARTPSSALGTTRDKPDLAYCQEIFKVLRAHEIEHFFYIGGNDSSDTVRIVSEEARKARYALRAIHIPKTIDNDLVGSDHTPGYPSAARFVAQAFAGVNLDNSALPGVYVGVVMGRHAGFLTAASALGKKFPDDGPHLIYLPERTFVLEQFLADVKATYARYGRCVIAVSEGIHDASGAPIATLLAKDLEHDDHGNVQLSGNGALADLLCEENMMARAGLSSCKRAMQLLTTNGALALGNTASPPAAPGPEWVFIHQTPAAPASPTVTAVVASILIRVCLESDAMVGIRTKSGTAILDSARPHTLHAPQNRAMMRRPTCREAL
jgi:6-phosphofructokinase